ncbi:MAG: hypothetical protein C5S47_02970 [Candidatus Methanogasteraceae archaeon]|nr:MAG: hypothetical protein C5S47_02970 [ANME-2 cluster archaeon]
MMREIPDELSRRYIEYPSAEGRDLQEIWKRYRGQGWGWWRMLPMMGLTRTSRTSDALMMLYGVATIGFGGCCKR